MRRGGAIARPLAQAEEAGGPGGQEYTEHRGRTSADPQRCMFSVCLPAVLLATYRPGQQGVEGVRALEAL